MIVNESCLHKNMNEHHKTNTESKEHILYDYIYKIQKQI